MDELINNDIVIARESHLITPEQASGLSERAAFARAVLRRVWIANGMSPQKADEKLAECTKKYFRRG
jgi:hypothetical protein